MLQVWPDPWAGSGDLDVRVISTGEAVLLEDHLVPGAWTIVDFGAAWCSPCHEAAHRIKAYMATHPEVVVRVVALPDDLREAPVVAQHLGPSPRLPTLLLFDPQGRQVYEGHRVARLLRVLERRSARRAAALSR